MSSKFIDFYLVIFISLSFVDNAVLFSGKLLFSRGKCFEYILANEVP